jgi:putative transposase
MPNHYHFLVRQDGDKSAGLLPQRVFNSYTKAYNLKYNRSGTLFQGPYQVRHITNNSYLLNLCRYIHANPVKDGLVADIDDWPYSNYLEWIGKRSGSLFDLRFVQEHFSSPQRYTEFVLDYLKNRDLPEEIRTYLNSWEELT